MRKAHYAILAGLIRYYASIGDDDRKRAFQCLAREFAGKTGINFNEFLKACGFVP